MMEKSAIQATLEVAATQLIRAIQITLASRRLSLVLMQSRPFIFAPMELCSQNMTMVLQLILLRASMFLVLVTGSQASLEAWAVRAAQ